MFTKIFSMNLVITNLAATAMLAVLSFTTTPQALADEKPLDALVKERVEMMKKMDASLENIANQAYGLFPFEQKEALRRANIIKSGLAKIEEMFPQGSQTKIALPVIWSDSKGFKKKIKIAAARTDKLIEAIEAKDKGQVSAIGKKLFRACASCHGGYRK